MITTLQNTSYVDVWTMTESRQVPECMVTLASSRQLTDRLTGVKIMARTAHIGTGYFKKSNGWDDNHEMNTCNEGTDNEFPPHQTERSNFVNASDDATKFTAGKDSTNSHLRHGHDTHKFGTLSVLHVSNSGTPPIHLHQPSGASSALHPSTSGKRSSEELAFISKRMRQGDENIKDYGQAYRTGESANVTYKKTTENQQAGDRENSVFSTDKTDTVLVSECASFQRNYDVSCQNTKQFSSVGSVEGVVSSKQRKEPHARINAVTVIPSSAIPGGSRHGSKMGVSSAGLPVASFKEDAMSSADTKLCSLSNRAAGGAHSTACTICVSNQLIDSDSDAGDSNTQTDPAASIVAEMPSASREKLEQVSYITLSCDTDPKSSAFRRCGSAPMERVADNQGGQEIPRSTHGFSHTIDSLVKERPEVLLPKESKGHSTRKRQIAPRKPDLSDDILREANGTMLTMGIIGCLPDNVQQAIKSFSIRPGKQHVTFAFPFMADMLRQCAHDVTVKDSDDHVSQALYCDHSNDVIDGYGTLVTLVPTKDRFSLPIGLFTLYQRDTVEGIVSHFQSLIRILMDEKMVLSTWKMPLCILDIKSSLKDLIICSCVNCIMAIQSDNVQKTFPGKTLEELKKLIKEQMISPSFRSYEDHFQLNVKDVTGKMAALDAERFLSLMDHIRSLGCTALDYQKADIMLRNAASPVLQSFWRVWSQAQISSKVFPIAMARRGTQRVETISYSTKPVHLGRSCVPVKEGLQSIIKCLKAQDVTNLNLLQKNERIKQCSCSVCRPPSLRSCQMRSPRDMLWNTDLRGSTYLQSAFHRPQPSYGGRLQLTTTPYSDALKAAASGPMASKQQKSGQADLLDITSVPTTNCQLEGVFPNMDSNFQYSIYSLLQTSNRHLLPTLPTTSNDLAFVPSLPAQSRGLLYPLVYKPVVITQNF